MSKKKSTQQFKDELLTINPTIEIIGEYVNNKIPILYRCKHCGNTHMQIKMILHYLKYGIMTLIEFLKFYQKN